MSFFFDLKKIQKSNVKIIGEHFWSTFSKTRGRGARIILIKHAVAPLIILLNIIKAQINTLKANKTHQNCKKGLRTLKNGNYGKKQVFPLKKSCKILPNSFRGLKLDLKWFQDTSLDDQSFPRTKKRGCRPPQILSAKKLASRYKKPFPNPAIGPIRL